MAALFATTYIVTYGLFWLRTRNVFARRAATLRKTAALLAPELPERAKLEAEASHLEEVGKDYARVAHDELVLNAPTAAWGAMPFVMVGSGKHRHRERGYTVEQKQEAADERTALLARNDGAEMEAARAEARPRWLRDGLIVPWLTLLIGIALAIWLTFDPCDHPLGGFVCLKATPDTYTCAISADGSCVAAPLAG